MSIAEEALQQLDRLGAIILDDVGDGPSPSDLAAAARATRDAVSQLAVPALTQLGGLISGVAESVVAGATEWNPSLGGTLIAAVDDLRHLASRAANFTDEDGEHLAHRASELRPYVSGSVSGSKAETASSSAPVPPEPVINEAPAPTPAPAAVVPIAELFYSDAGPHIVSGGTPKDASNKSELLGKGIEALDNLTMKPIATPATFGAMEVVPVESLLYRGRAALERAAAIREQIKASGGVASPATIEEMFDLIGLALKD
jgi:hypothetical protein